MDNNRFARSMMNMITRLHRQKNRFMQERMRQFGLTGPMYQFMISLHTHPGCSQDYLVENYGMDKGNVARAAKKMEAMGLIRRKVSLDDRRQYQLYLTEKGLAIMPHVKRALDDWAAQLCKDMTPAQRESAEEILQMMTDNIYPRENENGV